MDYKKYIGYFLIVIGFIILFIDRIIPSTVIVENEYLINLVENKILVATLVLSAGLILAYYEEFGLDKYDNDIEGCKGDGSVTKSLDLSTINKTSTSESPDTLTATSAVTPRISEPILSKSYD